MAKDVRLLMSHTPENWDWKEKENRDPGFSSFEALNPHDRTRNSLRFSEVGALAKCNKTGNRGTCQHGQYLGKVI